MIRKIVVAALILTILISACRTAMSTEVISSTQESCTTEADMESWVIEQNLPQRIGQAEWVDYPHVSFTNEEVGLATLGFVSVNGEYIGVNIANVRIPQSLACDTAAWQEVVRKEGPGNLMAASLFWNHPDLIMIDSNEFRVLIDGLGVLAVPEIVATFTRTPRIPFEGELNCNHIDAIEVMAQLGQITPIENPSGKLEYYRAQFECN